MNVTVVSASYGGYDQPVAPPPQDWVLNGDVRWVMVTDGLVDVPAPWETVVEPRSHLHPRMAAKVPKCLPFEYADTDIAIWLDASAVIRSSGFVGRCVEALGDGDVAQWVHPQRSCIAPEADVSACMEKYSGQPVQEQAAHYIKNGHPEDFGLWATGCMVWSRRAKRLGTWPGQTWLNEQNRWTYQDQLSWPVVVYRWNLDIRPMPGSLWDHQLLTFRPHASDR